MRIVLSILCLLAAWVPAQAAPFIVTDPYPSAETPKPTHCGWYLDAAAKKKVAVAKSTDGQPYCKLDIADIAAGTHTVTATHIVSGDPVWPETESAKSAPLTFTKPGSAGVPTGLSLSKT